ncbi:MAG: hypothetical protein ACOX4D_02820 [Bacteroidales bacterium]
MDNKKVNSNVKTMKKQGFFELIIAITGITTLLILQNNWSYIPLILYGLISVSTIRKEVSVFTNEEKKCIKKRNIISIITLPIFAFICYFLANEIIRDNLLWILLSIYFFLALHGILFVTPVNAFKNKKNN